MTANLQSRSASISSPVNEPVTLLNNKSRSSSGNYPKPSLRSSSIGSNFFNKDSSLFAATASPDTTLGGSFDSSEDQTEAKDDAKLDIVGALGNLNLDDDFDAATANNTADSAAPSAPGSAGATSGATAGPTTGPGAGATAASATAQYYQNYPQFYPQAQGSLTPNPNAFDPSFGSSSTPNTWSNNFIPSSAPQFTYNGSNADLALSVKPFELPEKSSQDDSIKLPGPFSTPPPPIQLFGGALDSQIKFGLPQNLPVGGPESDVAGEKSGSGPAPNKSSTQDLGQPHHPFPTRPFNGSNVGDFPLGPMADGATGVDSAAYNFVPDMNSNFNMPPHMTNVLPPLHPLPQLGGMWDQHMMRNGGGGGVVGGGQNNYMDRLNPGQNRFNPQMNRYQNNSNNHNNNNHNSAGGRRQYMNNGMNVHRKAHNNRRKGDDASKYANAKLEDFNGEIYSLCKDQHGCRFLQRQLDLGQEGKGDIAATMIFNEIYLKIVELMTDPFGNYLIQKLFENVSVDQRIILVKNAAPAFIRIALDPHGTRALQKLVECISTEEESQLIINSLSPHIVSLSRDLNGNHVVQKCLQKLKPEENQFIFDTASANCNEIATHRHGCCVLQRCLDHGNLQQRKQLSLKVAENANNLSLDPFGNYVVQYVLSRGDDESIKIILDHIRANIVSLSLHKFGSNVIEKSLRISKLTDDLIRELLANKHKFGEMVNDAFGNYVLQTSLDVASPSDLAKLSVALQPLLPEIKNTPHGRRIMTKIQSIL